MKLASRLMISSWVDQTNEFDLADPHIARNSVRIMHRVVIGVLFLPLMLAFRQRDIDSFCNVCDFFILEPKLFLGSK